MPQCLEERQHTRLRHRPRRHDVLATRDPGEVAVGSAGATAANHPAAGKGQARIATADLATAGKSQRRFDGLPYLPSCREDSLDDAIDEVGRDANSSSFGRTQTREIFPKNPEILFKFRTQIAPNCAERVADAGP